MNEWCPSRQGTYTAYEPEYKAENGKWIRVPVVQEPNGIPHPLANAGISSELGLFGREQAWALAWHFSAHVAATSFVPAEIRVAQYEVHYDMKAKRLEMPLNTAE